MMEFNTYVWQLYKNSTEGRFAIRHFSNLWEEITNGKFDLKMPNIPFEVSEGVWELSKIIIGDCSDKQVKSIEDAERLFTEIVKDFPVTYCDEKDGTEEEAVLEPEDFLYYLTELSVGLSTCFPEYFFPYFFSGYFYFFQQICETFDIPLSELPKKKDFDKRLAYYFELCRVLYEFRKNRNLSPVELCAFLYSFAPNSVSVEIDNELPQPMRVWIVGGGINNNGDPEYLDSVDKSAETQWQGNVNTRRGDIVLVYCLAPRSYIHSIWRAKTDGYIDPFYGFYSQVWLCNPIKTTPVTYNDLKADPILSQNGLVKSSMQGLNGRRFSAQEYEAILRIMESKGQNLSFLPRLDSIFDVDESDELLKDERDVEIHLVEPLLEKLCYQKGDWIRQMPITMGSGERIFPDYAFFSKQNKGEEQAKMILETKYRIRTEKELFKAYCQAKSYALRLQTNAFVIAAVEGLWIFVLGKKGFDLEKHIHKTWREIHHPDVFSSVFDLISAHVVKKGKIAGD